MNDINAAINSLKTATEFSQRTKSVSALCMYTKYILLGILAYQLARGVLMGILYFIGLSVGFFIVGLVIVQASRLLFLRRDPIQREAYLMNCVIIVQLVMTACLLVYIIAR